MWQSFLILTSVVGTGYLALIRLPELIVKIVSHFRPVKNTQLDCTWQNKWSVFCVYIDDWNIEMLYETEITDTWKISGQSITLTQTAKSQYQKK